MRRRVLASVGKALPYLRRVAYLESTGSQYIDTGCNFDFGNDYEIGLEIVESPASGCIFGVNGSNDEYLAYYYSPSRHGVFHIFGDYNEINYEYLNVFQNLKLHIESQNTNLIVDEHTIIHYPSSTRTKNYNLHALIGGAYSVGDAASLALQKVKYYSFKCVKDEVTVVDFIPVIDLSGRPAMYDEVSGRLFYNQGTGEFTWGELGE